MREAERTSACLAERGIKDDRRKAFPSFRTTLIWRLKTTGAAKDARMELVGRGIRPYRANAPPTRHMPGPKSPRPKPGKRLPPAAKAVWHGWLSPVLPGAGGSSGPLGRQIPPADDNDLPVLMQHRL
jgi:hypothetical protein